MARMVTRRKGPPYLLIVFVILFVISTSLLVLVHMKWEDEQKKVVNLDATLKKLASEHDRKLPSVMDMMKPPEKGEQPTTVIEKYITQQKELTKMITGQETTPEDAIKKVEDLRREVKYNDPLIEVTRTLFQAGENKDKRIKDLEGERDDAMDKREKAQKLAGELADNLKAEKDKAAQDNQDLLKKFGTFQQEHQKQLEDARKDWEANLATLNKNVAGKTQEIETLKLKEKQLQLAVKKLQDEINDRKRPETASAPERQPDGKIMKVLEGENTCYVTLGAKDRVMPGLTFSVYPPSGVTESGEGKGSVTITNVNEGVSECRIDKQDAANPIIADDLIANVVFDATKQYTFVVEGQFDLFGTGQPSPVGTEEVKMMIKRFSGKVADGVDAETDFVVMGSEPPPPPKPADNAPEQTLAIYKERKRLFDHYREVRALAQSMRIPILNTNRFLAFVGYTPSKAAK